MIEKKLITYKEVEITVEYSFTRGCAATYLLPPEADEYEVRAVFVANVDITNLLKNSDLENIENLLNSPE